MTKPMIPLCALVMVVCASGWPQRQTLAQTPAGEVVLSVDPANSDVHWTLGTTLHTVHGTFGVSRGMIQIEPATGKASGKVVVDAKSGGSGNEARDKKMHREVLESDRFTQIVFLPKKIDGKLLDSATSTVRFYGVLLLHGQEHEIDVPVEARMDGERWMGTARFSVPYVQWGLKNPSNFILKVKPKVELEIKFAGAVQKAAQ